jgi:hypothetical protein
MSSQPYSDACGISIAPEPVISSRRDAPHISVTVFTNDVVYHEVSGARMPISTFSTGTISQAT